MTPRPASAGLEATTHPPRQSFGVLAVTRAGARLGTEIAAALGERARLYVGRRYLDEAAPGAEAIDGRLADTVRLLYPQVEGLVFVLAVGAVVRLVAPLLADKHADPAVVAVDEGGRHAVPVVGGHAGGANALAVWIADTLGAEPIITTATDAVDLPAVDLLGADNGWRIASTPDEVREMSAAILDGETVAVYQEAGSPEPLHHLPPDWPRLDSLTALAAWDGPALVVSDRDIGALGGADAGTGTGRLRIVYRPPTLVLGVGCSRGATADEIEALGRATLTESGYAPESVRVMATIDRRLDEPGMVETAARFGRPLVGFSAAELSSIDDLPTPSAEVERYVGAPGVCEPAALLASDGGSLVVSKRKSARVTVAVARLPGPTAASPGQLSLIGLGPGAYDSLTPRARRALRKAHDILGYRAYLESLVSLVGRRRLRPSELGQERERAAEALDRAASGRRVALVSSGDIGIYGMAGLVFELLDERRRADPAARVPDVEVVPGITAASAAAALLGAPLMHDFAVVSLSDLLVPWDLIERRLRAAAEGDLTLMLYNPASRRRRWQIERARDILLAVRPAETAVGLVREAYRPEQRIGLTTLGVLGAEDVDMNTIVLVGCSRTVRLGDVLVTRRGYLDATRVGQACEPAAQEPTVPTG
ncbi:MAG: precorrin-3B C(17)-methyltransferase [Chloroflexi bacterium]|nr:precorrin-3B C(17)-methyltransferase [Chloroflexota bacterium]